MQAAQVKLVLYRGDTAKLADGLLYRLLPVHHGNRPAGAFLPLLAVPCWVCWAASSSHRQQNTCAGTRTATLMSVLAVCYAGYIDVEADEITPGYAVLLMYIMLVGLWLAKRRSSFTAYMTSRREDGSP